jgi:hypothetical protein
MIEAQDPAQNRLLVDVSFPMWVTLQSDQRAAEFLPGEMATFYVESGAWFEPAA